MRTEDDLRAALRALESRAPAVDDVLSAVYSSSPGLSRSWRLRVLRMLHIGPFWARQDKGARL